jgi:hypothetical protein
MFVGVLVLMLFGGLLVEIVDDVWRFHPLAVLVLAFAVYMLVRTIVWLVQRHFLERHWPSDPGRDG